jgi:hypothetical protein
MKIPSWFIFGCGLLLLNAFVVLGGALVRHAVAQSPEQTPDERRSSATADFENDDNLATARAAADLKVTLPLSDSQPDESTRQSHRSLPEIPSLDELPPANASTGPHIIGIEDFKRVFAEQTQGPELPLPLTDVLNSPAKTGSDPMSHEYFEALKLRLKSVESLNRAAQSLVAEATILFQRGEVRQAQDLLGTATQLRELAAKLLVTRQ